MSVLNLQRKCERSRTGRSPGENALSIVLKIADSGRQAAAYNARCEGFGQASEINRSCVELVQAPSRYRQRTNTNVQLGCPVARCRIGNGIRFRLAEAGKRPGCDRVREHHPIRTGKVARLRVIKKNQPRRPRRVSWRPFVTQTLKVRTLGTFVRVLLRNQAHALAYTRRRTPRRTNGRKEPRPEVSSVKTWTVIRLGTVIADWRGGVRAGVAGMFAKDIHWTRSGFCIKILPSRCSVKQPRARHNKQLK